MIRSCGRDVYVVARVNNASTPSSYIIGVLALFTLARRKYLR